MWNRKSKLIESQKKEIESQKKEIESQKKEIESQKKEIKELKSKLEMLTKVEKEGVEYAAVGAGEAVLYIPLEEKIRIDEEWAKRNKLQ